jgi:hypothetical protein
MGRAVLNVMSLLVFVCAPLLQSFAQQREPSESAADIAQSVAGSGTPFEKTKKLVTWINTSFQWTATDYQQRTPQEIIQRRGGNCAELASVLEVLLREAHIRYRWIAEINVQPASESRQHNSERRIAAVGNQASVFGFMHNDHRWLEVYDDSNSEWFPADPAVGVVGIQEWVLARLGIGERPAPSVSAVADIVKDMLVPFVIVAMDSRNGKQLEDRSEFYLIAGFNKTYKGRLSSLQAWRSWTAAVHRLSPKGRLAFAGEMNLHQNEAEIKDILATYQELRGEALEAAIARGEDLK